MVRSVLHNEILYTNILLEFTLIRFCTAGDDRKLQYFVSDGRSSSSVTVLEGHLSYINDCVIEPVSGLDVASVSGKH